MSTNLAYQDEIRQELINGQIVLMSPRPMTNHNRVAFNIAYIFERHLREKNCTTFSDGEELYLTNKDHFIPDGMVVCNSDKIKYNGVHGAPDLVWEVLSPTTAKRDKGYKKQVYEQCGVKEYWIVEPIAKSLEQYCLTDEQLQLVEVYSMPPDYLTAEDKAEYLTEFKCSLYDDLIIKLEDVFYRLI